jgi:hypothetical protein
MVKNNLADLQSTCQSKFSTPQYNYAKNAYKYAVKTQASTDAARQTLIYTIIFIILGCVAAVTLPAKKREQTHRNQVSAGH